MATKGAGLESHVAMGGGENRIWLEGGGGGGGWLNAGNCISSSFSYHPAGAAVDVLWTNSPDRCHDQARANHGCLLSRLMNAPCS